MHPRELERKLKDINRLFTIRHHSKLDKRGDGIYYGNRHYFTIPPGHIWPRKISDYKGLFGVSYRSLGSLIKKLVSDGKIKGYQIKGFYYE